MITQAQPDLIQPPLHPNFEWYIKNSRYQQKQKQHDNYYFPAGDTQLAFACSM